MDQSTLRKRIIFRRVIQIVVVVAIFVMAVTPINHENDIFWQLRMGEEIVTHHHFPTADPYSSSAYGEVWTLHEWMPSVLFYLINSHVGPAGLILFKAVFMAVTFALFLILFNTLKANLYLSLLVFVLAALVNTRGAWVVFPSMFEYLFLVVTLLLLELYKKKKLTRIPVALMLLSFLWANSHGSFFLLPIVVSFYLVGDVVAAKLTSRWSWYAPGGQRFDRSQKKLLLTVIVVSLIAPIATPNGAITYLYPFRISFGAFTQYVSEYQTLLTVWKEDRSYFVHVFAFMLMFILFFMFIAGRKKIHATDFLVGIFFIILPLTAVRHIAIFSLVALFLIVRSLSLWFGEYRGVFARSLVKDLLVIMITICFLYFYKTKLAPFGLHLSEGGYPQAAAELVNGSGISGNMFNHYNYGGYLIWKMPDYKVFIDGRLEMYEGKAGEDYLTILGARPGYKELLEKYKVNFFLIDVSAAIVEPLVDDPQWKYVYHDKDYVVFVRDAPGNAVFLSHHWSQEKNRGFREEYKRQLSVYRAEKYNQRGVEAIFKNDVAAARTAFESSIRYNPSVIVTHLNLAQVLVVLGMPQKAKEEYTYIIANLDPNNQEAKNGLTNIDALK